MAIQQVWKKNTLVSARCPECGAFTKKIKRYPFELRYYRKRYLTSQTMAFCEVAACCHYWEILTPDSYRELSAWVSLLRCPSMDGSRRLADSTSFSENYDGKPVQELTPGYFSSPGP